MVTFIPASPILRTKLHRPSVPRDYLHRPHLVKKLTQGVDRTLSLVSAPAGYGKSTLLSSWLNGCGILNAWLSLDENDNDPTTFLNYFITAVRTIFPEALAESRAIIASAVIPEQQIIANILVAELSRIEESFVVVLDDYHLINNDLIHEIMISVLKLPSSPMHLALAARKDPPMPLATYRAKGWVTEIRLNDLRFSKVETAAFVEKCAGKPIAESVAVALENKTEGWVTALRLASLSVRNDPDLDRIVSNLPEDNQYVAEYIVNEVITQQPAEIQEYLMRTALLNRFCIPLCEVLCMPGKLPETCTIGGREFIGWLMDNNLFVIPLDSQNRWFRYHHLFQKVLHRRLKQQFDQNQIRQIHQRAGDWFVGKGLLDEALYHRLEAGHVSGAGRIVADSRHDLMNQEQWHRIELWMKKLPQEMVENDIELMLTKAWLCENRMQLVQLLEVVDRIEILRNAADQIPEEENRTEGEYNALKAATCYIRGDGEVSVSHARMSIDYIPKDHSSELAFALIVLALGLQMVGDGAQGRQVILEALSRAGSHVRTYHARLLFGLCFLDWLEADMHGVRQTAEQVIVFGKSHDLLESLSFGHYFMGLALYHLDDLPGAEPHLQMAIKNGKLTNINTFAHASYLLALTLQSREKPEVANDVARAVIAYALMSHNTSLLQEAKAFQAELAFRQNRLPAAAHWAKSYDPFPLIPVLRFYLPPLTLLKVWIAEDSQAAHKQADELADRLVEYYKATNNNRVLVEVLALQALLQVKLQQNKNALSFLKQAVDLSRPGGNCRPFIDLGQPIADLLDRIYKTNGEDPFVNGILEAIGKKPDFDTPAYSAVRPTAHPGTPHALGLAEPLSIREMEVLQLLSQHLRDKEIAERLFISPATVKRHCANIYSKLEVKGRRKAVEQAHALGMM